MKDKIKKFIKKITGTDSNSDNKKSASLEHGGDLTNSKIRKIVESVIEEEINFTVEHPTELSHGDYSTNIAMVLAKGKNANPRELAEVIVDKIKSKNISDIEKIEIAGPGFINFYLSKKFFEKSVNQILDSENDYGKNESLSGKNILIEYTDPNPFKQFHIGHLMSNSIGEALSRIFEWNGANVKRLCYQGDVGQHVAKAIWGMEKQKEAFPHDTDSIEDKIKFLGDTYAYGASKYEEDENSKSEINEVNKKIYNLFNEDVEKDQELKIYYDKGREWSLEHFNDIYKTLGTEFDKFIFESEVAKIGEEIVRKNTGKVFEMSDGAVVYKGEQDGLHTRVFINSIGLPTYETKDIGLAFLKEETEKFDKSVIVTASEQSEYFKVVLSALSKIDKKVSEKTDHVSHGMMRFKEGKMSSRTGNVITGMSLVDSVKELVDEKVSDRGFNEKQTEEIKDAVSIGAIKYSILKQSPGKDIIFDPEKSVSFEGDSGPYLQYTFARANSVLEKSDAKSKVSIPEEWKITDLEKILYRFPEVIENCYSDYSPQNLVTYLTLVASEFNSFYANNQILDGGADQEYKIAITKSVSNILKNGLEILAIKSPERM